MYYFTELWNVRPEFYRVSVEAQPYQQGLGPSIFSLCPQWHSEHCIHQSVSHIGRKGMGKKHLPLFSLFMPEIKIFPKPLMPIVKKFFTQLLLEFLKRDENITVGSNQFINCLGQGILSPISTKPASIKKEKGTQMLNRQPISFATVTGEESGSCVHQDIEDERVTFKEWQKSGYDCIKKIFINSQRNNSLKHWRKHCFMRI